jgi:replication-associated recombination protein RarA
MKKTKPAIITGVSPSNWKPASAEDFIGVAREVAGILEIKARKLLSSGAALRLLLYGPPGTGKTAIAAWLAAMLAGHSSNVDRKSGKQIGVEEVRRWMSTLGMGSLFGYQVRLINELDKCSDDAQVMLLEYADELRDNCALIATSNLDIQHLQQRFQTRWMQYEITPPSQDEIAGLLARFGVAPDSAQMIGFGAGGNVRAALLDAEAHLDVTAYRALKAA